MDERRKWIRYPIAYPVDIRRIDGSGGTGLKTIDISRGGIAVDVPDVMGSGDRVNLKVYLKKRMFALDAFVVYSVCRNEGSHKTGVRFDNAPEDFAGILSDEVAVITQMHRASSLYKHNNISFERTASAYLEDIPPSGVV